MAPTELQERAEHSILPHRRRQYADNLGILHGLENSNIA